jgi:hypothetical protein
VGLLGEDGKPVPANDEGPKVEIPDPVAEIVLPKVVIEVQPDGNLSIQGPKDLRLVLRMLHEAVDLCQASLASNLVLSKLAERQAGVQKPGLRDVLAFSKVRP